MLTSIQRDVTAASNGINLLKLRRVECLLKRIDIAVDEVLANCW